MNDEFSTAFEAELALVERLVEPPTGDPGYGSDLSCLDDLAEDCAELDGNDPRVVAEYAYRRMNTAAGDLADDPDWGIDVAAMLSKGMTQTEIRGIKDTIRGEIARDDRLENVACETTWNPSTEELSIALSADLAETGDSFSLTAVATSDGMNIVELVINGST